MIKEKSYFIKTYGCQMNKADSERIAGYLEGQGFKEARSLNEADLIILNSCVVRQSAEDSIYGFKKEYLKLKKKNPSLKVVLTGCLVGSAKGKRKRIDREDLREKLSWIDDFWPIGKFKFNIEAKRLKKDSALVPISVGCDNFCSYCVVPYARGKEESRDFKEIICEVENLVKRGYKEVILLGQNVNSYGNDWKSPLDEMKKSCGGGLIHQYKKPFPVLLARLNQIKGLKKIRFLTSHPKDLSNELIEAISNLQRVEKYIHLPIQAGDDEILKKMNRNYTVAHYKNLIRKLRQKIPNIKLGTDIIVGFPGETKEQFQHTVDLYKEMKFDVAFIAMYSPRPGTTAFKLEDDVLREEKKRRHKVLMQVIKNIPTF